MREWLSRRRLPVATGTLLVVAVIVGSLWGLADVGDATPNEAGASTTTGGLETTVTTDEFAQVSTTITSATTTSTTFSATTTDRQTPTTQPPGGGTTRTTEPNLPPSIDDLGVTSDGLTLHIEPVVSDPEGDDLQITYSLDDVEVFTGSEGLPHTVSLDLDDVGYAHTATVVITVDDGTQTVTDFVEHELAAVTSVVVREISYDMRLPDSCFESSAAERISGVIVFSGPVDTTREFSVELRPDRPDAVLVAGLTGEIAGEPPRQVVELTQLRLAGDSGSPVTKEFAGTDSALASLFTNACRGTLNFRVEMETQ